MLLNTPSKCPTFAIVQINNNNGTMANNYSNAMLALVRYLSLDLVLYLALYLVVTNKEKIIELSNEP